MRDRIQRDRDARFVRFSIRCLLLLPRSWYSPYANIKKYQDGQKRGLKYGEIIGFSMRWTRAIPRKSSLMNARLGGCVFSSPMDYIDPVHVSRKGYTLPHVTIRCVNNRTNEFLSTLGVLSKNRLVITDAAIMKFPGGMRAHALWMTTVWQDRETRKIPIDRSRDRSRGRWRPIERIFVNRKTARYVK